MKHLARHTMVLAVFAVVVATLSAKADTIRWRQHDTDGDWNDGTMWTNITSGAYPVVPGTGDVVDITKFYTSTGTRTITLNSTMYPNGVTNASWDLDDVYSYTSRGYLIDAYGTEGSPLTISLIGPATRVLDFNKGREIHFNYVNLELSGSTDHDLYNGCRLGGRAASIIASNTTIRSSSAPSGKGLDIRYGGYKFYYPRVHMYDSSLIVTNTTGDAWINIQGTSVGAVANNCTALLLYDTILDANNLTATANSLLRMDNGGISNTNRISGTLTVDDGALVDLKGGHFAIGTVTYGGIGTGYTGTAMVVNGATGTVETLLMRTTDSSSDPSLFAVSNGVATIGNANIGSTSVTRGFYELRVSGGSCRVNGNTVLGYNAGTARHGSGLLAIDGGAFESGNLNIGVSGNASGYFEQAEGSAIITNTLTLFTESSTYGTKQFVVGTPATLTFKGAAFVKSGATAWAASLLTTNNLNLSGTLVFDPAPGVTAQNLLAFGAELGPVMEAVAATNFPIATLNLSGVDGAEQVSVTGAGNESTNALYISTLLGVTPANAATVLDSTINVYYHDTLNIGLLSETYVLNSGGALLPFNKIQRATAILIL